MAIFKKLEDLFFFLLSFIKPVRLLKNPLTPSSTPLEPVIKFLNALINLIKLNKIPEVNISLIISPAS